MSVTFTTGRPRPQENNYTHTQRHTHTLLKHIQRTHTHTHTPTHTHTHTHTHTRTHTPVCKTETGGMQTHTQHRDSHRTHMALEDRHTEQKEVVSYGK